MQVRNSMLNVTNILNQPKYLSRWQYQAYWSSPFCYSQTPCRVSRNSVQLYRFLVRHMPESFSLVLRNVSSIWFVTTRQSSSVELGKQSQLEASYSCLVTSRHEYRLTIQLTVKNNIRAACLVYRFRIPQVCSELRLFYFQSWPHLTVRLHSQRTCFLSLIFSTSEQAPWRAPARMSQYLLRSTRSLVSVNLLFVNCASALN